MAQYPWLMLRSGRWVVRAPVPNELVAVVGRKEVWRALKTADRAEALLRYHDVAREIQKQFEAHRKPLDLPIAHPVTPVSSADIKAFADAHYHRIIEDDFLWRAQMWAAVKAGPRRRSNSGRLVPLVMHETYSVPPAKMQIEEHFLLRLNNQRRFRHQELVKALALGDCSSQAEPAQSFLGGRIAPEADLVRLRRSLLQAEIDALSSLIDGRAFEDAIIAGHRTISHASAPTIADNVTWEVVIARWENAHRRLGKPEPTRRECRAKVEKFAAAVKKPPAKVTEADVQAWRDKRLDDGIAPATVAHSDLSMLRAVFKVAVQEKVLAQNPAKSVTVIGYSRNNKPKDEKMAGFNEHEALIILNAARQESISHRRWVPWLCATTGSRVSTMINLRPQDVREIDGIWCVEITRKAGPIKTNESARILPIHEELLRQGFLKFVRGRRNEPRLFYDEARKRSDAPQHNPGRTKGGHLRDWLHEVAEQNDLAIGRKNKKDPTHGWRHRIMTMGRKAGVSDSILDQITGHKPRTVGEDYGETDLATLREALNKISMPRVP